MKFENGGIEGTAESRLKDDRETSSSVVSEVARVTGVLEGGG